MNTTRTTVLLVTALAVLLAAPMAAAHAGEAELNETGDLIAQGHSCSELSTEQLVAIGDYYMEQMHPGEEHELMDEQLGGENSTEYRDAHLHMADRFYCDSFGGSATGGWMPMMGSWGGMMMPFGGLSWLAIVLAAGILIGYLLRERTADDEDNA